MDWLLAAAAFAPPEDVVKAGADAASTLTQTALGSMLVLTLIVCGLLGWLVVKAKNAHLADKDVMREQMLQQAIQSRELAAETTRGYEALMRLVQANSEQSAQVLAGLGKLSEQVRTMASDSAGHCRDAEQVSAKIDALVLAIPNVDHDKYYLATKGGR
jgi:uncharacterized protein HemX